MSVQIEYIRKDWLGSWPRKKACQIPYQEWSCSIAMKCGCTDRWQGNISLDTRPKVHLVQGHLSSWKYTSTRLTARNALIGLFIAHITVTSFVLVVLRASPLLESRWRVVRILSLSSAVRS